MKIIDTVMRYRNTLLLVASLSLGLIAALGTRGYIANEIAAERARLQPRTETASVVVAKSDLARGDVASAQTMAVREIPREYLPTSVIRPDQFEGWSGARLSAPMKAGEPLLHSSLEGADVATFSAKVRSGIRAMTVSVDEVNSISGMLQPGDRIDLMLSLRAVAQGGAMGPEVTRPLLQDVKVLATGRQVRPGGDERQARNYNAMTIEVTPEQAQKLVVAQRSGKLTAMLRNPGDHAPIAQTSLDVYGLLGIGPSGHSTESASPDLIVGGRGPLKVVAGLASANQSAPGTLITATRGGLSGLDGGWTAPAGNAPPVAQTVAGPQSTSGTEALVRPTEPRPPSIELRLPPEMAAPTGADSITHR